MEYLINAPHLTAPTYDTLVDYAKKRFSKLERLLKRKNESDYEIRVGVEKSGQLYELVAEVQGGPVKQVAKASDRDIRKVVDLAVDKLKRVISSSDKRSKYSKSRRKMVLEKLKSVTSFRKD